VLQPTEVLMVGAKREFVVLEVDDVYGEVILSLRALEVRPQHR
jgi:ribosomal protein S1